MKSILRLDPVPPVQSLMMSGAPSKEALDNRSPVEAVPCTNWELRALTGAAEGQGCLKVKLRSRKWS
jgi:hypothetical protein